MRTAAVTTAADAARGKQVAARIDTGTEIVTRTTPRTQCSVGQSAARARSAQPPRPGAQPQGHPLTAPQKARPLGRKPARVSARWNARQGRAVCSPTPASRRDTGVPAAPGDALARDEMRASDRRSAARLLGTICERASNGTTHARFSLAMRELAACQLGQKQLVEQASWAPEWRRELVRQAV